MKTINSKNSELVVKVKRVVCPQCLSAEIISVYEKLQTVECSACGHKFEVKNEVH